MDISDLVKVAGKFLPILLFLIYVVVMAIANAKKRGPAGKPLPPVERPPLRRQGQSEKKEDGTPGISEDLKRTLETIFREKETKEGNTPEPAAKDDTGSDLSTSKEAAVLEEQAAIQRAFEEVQRKAGSEDRKEMVSFYNRRSEKEIVGETFSLSHNELRKGVIWSEILAPPVSMR